MDEELVLVAAMIGGAIAMIVGIVAYQRRHERLLATQTTIDLPIESVVRSLAVVLPAAVVVPVVVGVVGAVGDPWMRGHALGAVLVGTFGSAVAIVASVMATRRWRRIGGLLCSPDRLELRVGVIVNAIDLRRPFDVVEAQSLGPQGVPLQIVILTQDARTWAFGYGLPITQTARGDVVDAGRCPLVGAGARVVHERLLAVAQKVPHADVERDARAAVTR